MQESEKLKSGGKIRLPKLLKPGEGEVHQLLGEPRIFKVTPAENAGACLQFETSHAPGAQIPVHAHLDEDEAFYILGGQFDFLVGKHRTMATPGSFLFVPRGIFHGFGALGSDVGRMLVTVTPGTGHEGFFREASELAQRLNEAPGKQMLLALSLKHGWVWPEGVKASVQLLELAAIRLIASGRLRIGKWEIMVPALAAAVLILALYFSLAEEWHPLAAPAVALAWCALGSATIALAPDRMRSIGEKLADHLHLSNQT